MTEYSESIELSDQDQSDLDRLFAEPDGVEATEAPAFHTVLEVWREVLRPASALAGEKVTPAYAGKMVQSYPGIGFADVQELQARYYAKIEQLLDILHLEISTDDNCLVYTDPAEDAAENAHHYKNLLATWQLLFQQWELEWDCTDPAAAVELAAWSEVYKMFFGPTGITQFLDNIKLEYTEDDSATLSELLQDQREEFLAGAVTGE